MDRIKVISEDLASKIAAGEVIENQASIVKELVENSIDAKATKIEISLIDAGFQLIQVIDNGIGMSKNDLLISTYPHATSKISESYDLFNISSLGFRGEALASITSIARLIISSNDSNSDGYVYQVNEYKLKEGYANKGTKVEVYNLFYNVPARFKYLKSQTSELANIIDFVSKVALSNPNIAFSLSNDDKLLLKTNGNNDIIEIISKIYSLDIANNMEEISFGNNDFKVHGYISNKHVTRSNKNAITISINNRIINNKELVNAIINSYATYLMERRYPIVMLNIEMDYQLIDVNIHPAKLEVKVSKILDLISLIEDSIRNHFLIKQQEFIKKINNDKQEELDFVYKNISNVEYNHISEEVINDEKIIYSEKESKNKSTNLTNDNDAINHNLESKPLISTSKISFNVIGQYNASYILASNEKGLHLIDQHAAMERINYEKIKQSTLERNYDYYDLISPIVLELNLASKTKILSFFDDFKALGLELEQLSNNDLIIRRIPNWIELNRAKEYIDNIVNMIFSLDRIDINKVKKDDLILASCKMSLKANTYLSLSEQQTLLNELVLYNDYDHCPHGRPIIISFTLKDIEKLFKRIV